MELACNVLCYPNGTIALHFPSRSGKRVPPGNFTNSILTFKRAVGLDWEPLHDKERKLWVILPKYDIPVEDVEALLPRAFKSWGVDLDLEVIVKDEDTVWPESRLC